MVVYSQASSHSVLYLTIEGLTGLAPTTVAMLDDWSLFRRDGVRRSFALLLNWKGDGGLQLFRERNGWSYSVLLDRSIRRVDVHLTSHAGDESGFGGSFERSVLADKNLVGSTRLETVHGIAVLDVLGLVLTQLHALTLVETYS